MNHKKLYAIDFVRVVAMLAVVAIHVTSEYVYAESGYTVFGINFGFIFNQVSRFAVPMFVLVSGISLGLGSDDKGILHFYKRRLVKLGIPYAVWFTLYFLYAHRDDLSGFAAGGKESAMEYLRGFVQGQYAPHLYFVIIIFQCYLFYPLIKRCVKKAPVASFVTALAITYIVETWYFLKYFEVSLIPRVLGPYLWFLLPTWIFYFVAGCVLTRERIPKLQSFAERHKLALIGGTLVFAGVYVVDSYAMNALDSIKISLNVYTLLVLVSLLAVWGWIGKSGRVRDVVGFLSNRSMTVYFCHIFALEFFRRFSFIEGTRGMVLLYCAVLLVSVAAAFVIDSAVAWLRRKPQERKAN